MSKNIKEQLHDGLELLKQSIRSSEVPFERLGGCVREALEQQPDPHKAVAIDCGLSEPSLSRLVTGASAPLDHTLIRLAHRLGLDPGELLLLRAVGRLHQKLGGAAASPEARAWWSAVEAIEQVADRYAALLDGLGRDPDAPRTLDRFGAGGFDVGSVVVGDRRFDWGNTADGQAQISSPRSPADLLARAASPGDLCFLPALGLPRGVAVRCDTELVMPVDPLDPDDPARSSSFARALDHDMLVVGSPSVNLLAEKVNRAAFFSFALTKEASLLRRQIELELEPLRSAPLRMRRWAEDPENLRRISEMHDHFSRPGLVDPIRGADYTGDFVRGRRLSKAVRHGLVSLAVHPWCPSRLAVFVGGRSRVGTVVALRALSRPEVFAERPLGGVFRVELPLVRDIRRALPPLEWLTPPYTLDDARAALDAHAAALGARFDVPVDALRGVLERIKGDREGS
ncbi:MAG: helix-turn-helix transcriptional regulator [Alphaproteobacteria bacterium]|nr:helix-turn-helix transcriptional regulator [Alphaproteobacteria bacterium]